MENTLISIIIPIYNVKLYVERCLRSVMNQINTTNFECIIVDDCGSDKSMEIVKRLLSSYTGSIEFRIIYHNVNQGLSAARNTGINEAKGEYIFFLDSDDEILPETMYLFEEYIRRHPQIDCVVGDIYASYPFSKWIRVKSRTQFFIDGNQYVQRMMLRRNPIPVTAWNKAIRKEVITEKGLYFKDGFIHEDEVWSYFLSRYVNSYGYINYATYVYYQNPHSIVTNRVKSIINKILILELFVDDVNITDVYSRFRLILEWIFDIFFNISLLDENHKININIDTLNKKTRDFFKIVLKTRYLHIAILLTPYIFYTKLGKFRGKYLSRLFSRILRIL